MTIEERFQNLKSVDDRERFVLAPARLVKTWGSLENTATLLAEGKSQVPMNGPLTPAGVLSPTILKNDGGDHAAFLLDFGREMHGTFRLYFGVPDVKFEDGIDGSSNPNVGGGGAKQAKVRIRLGESISEALTPVGGPKNATNNHAVRDADFLISAMSILETAESGFRFAYVELLNDHAVLPIHVAEAVLIVYDLPRLGSFRSDDPRLDKIYDTAAWTLQLNLQRYLWDGIKRDRLVWMGDMNTEIKTALTLYGTSAVIKRSLDYMRDTTPIDEWMNGISSYSVWWVICHADYFMATDDLTYLKEQREYLLALMKKLASRVLPDGSEDLPGFKFIDWPNQASPEATHAGLQGILSLGLQKGAFMLETLGENETAALCRAAEEKLHHHIPDPMGSKQAAAFLSLSGVGDRQKLFDSVIAPGGAKGYSTFLGYYTLTAAALAGGYDVAMKSMLDYWGGMLDMGATSFWEDFNVDWMENAYGIDSLPVEGKKDIHGDFGGYCYIGLRHSLCHGWSSGPVTYISENVLGVKFLAPGGKKVKIEPHLSHLHFCEGSVPTAYGVIYVKHEKQPDGTVKSEIALPFGVERVE